MKSEKFQMPSLDQKQTETAVLLGVVTLTLLWGYFNSLWAVAQFWDSPEYSHGYLVPMFTLALLWMRREELPGQDQISASARWVGLALIALGLSIRLPAAYYNFAPVDGLTFLPCLAGVVLLVAGWPTLRWAGPAIGFLIFMYPLPGPLQRNLLAPLQKVATLASAYSLQTLGFDVYTEGNRISISEIDMNVVEACSGLRMLTIFMALAVATTLVTKRPWWEQAIIILSAVPIALISNITRITITGILHVLVGSELADAVFHDFAGWIMMPIAIALLYLELYVLSLLFIEESETVDGMPFAFAGASGGPQPKPPRGPKIR